MKARLPLVVMLGGSLTFLASLYLSWSGTQTPPCHNPESLLCMVGNASGVATGWSSGVSDAAALAALMLAAAALATLLRPSLADRLPLGASSLMLLFLAVGTLALDWQRASFDAHWDHGTIVWFFGGYLAFAAATVTALAAWVFRDVAVPRTPVDAVAWAIGIGLLVTFALPWHRVVVSGRAPVYTTLGISASTELAAALVLLGLSRQRWRGLCWTGAAVLTLPEFGLFAGPGASASVRAYGLWLGLGFAVAVLAGAALSARGQWRGLARPGPRDALLIATAALYVASLFLPWQRVCDARRGCSTATGWTIPSSTAALLFGLAVVAVLLRRGERWLPELGVGAALLVVAAGMNPPFSTVPGSHWAYGAVVSDVAGGVFVVLCLTRSPIQRGLGARVLPAVTSILLLAAISVPLWDVLRWSWQSEATALTGWLAAAGLLLTVHVLFLWAGPSPAVLVLPLGVLALVVVQAFVERVVEPTWGTCIAGGLCLVIAAFGWAEQRGGLGSLRIPDEIWRIDRISGVEN